jgi:sialate O-acetylesterase
LQEELDVPVGLVQSAWGGAPIEPWISREAMMAAPTLRDMAEDTVARRAWEAKRKPDTKSPEPHQLANQLFNGKIHPLIPFAMLEALWCQGESSSERSTAYYRAALEALIADWRTRLIARHDVEGETLRKVPALPDHPNARKISGR